MKKIISVLLISLLVLSLFTACGSSNDSKAPETAAPESATPESAEGVAGEGAGLVEAFAEAPVLITSAGQSQEIQMLKTILDKAGFEYTLEGLVEPDAIVDYKTIAIVVGGSSKGLGAAGIDAESEIARTEALVAKAEENGLSIIILHLGKDARRGELSDKFITPTLDVADYMIVVEGGNNDGIFSNAAAKNGTPLEVVPSLVAVSEAFTKAFK